MTEIPDEERTREGSYQEGQVLMPFYIICDISGSMSSDIGSLNTALKDLVTDISTNPVAADLAMLSVITFDDYGKVVVPLSRPEDITVPTITIGGGTSFSEAFKTYHTTFEQDRARLKAAGSRVFRPCIFFLTDGEPWQSDPYKETFKQLLACNPQDGSGNRAYPYVVAYGFRDATEAVMSTLAYPNFGEKRGQWFLSRTGDVNQLLKSISKSIAQTVISSGLTVPTGQPQILAVAPDVSAGMKGGFAVDDYV